MPYIISSGEVSGVILENDTMTVLDSGVAMTTTVNSEGRLYVSSGGTANSTTVNSRGILEVSSGGIASDTTINSRGSMFVSSGGIASDTTVNSSGSMFIYSGGTATNIIASSDAYLRLTIASDTYIQGTSGGVAFEIKDALLSGYTVNRGGYLYVSSGGIANKTTLINGGMLVVYSGGIANSTTVNFSGSLIVDSGGTTFNTRINSGGKLYISSGGMATNIVWTPCEGHVSVYEGAIATFADEYSGVYYGSNNQLLSHEAMLDGMEIGKGFEMYVMSDGNVKNIVVSSGGSMCVSNGGIANNITVNGSGLLNISSGGIADGVTINSMGSLHVSRGGTATNIVGNSGAPLWVDVASNTYVHGTYNGNTFEIKVRDTILSGFMVDRSFYICILSGVTAISTTVNSGDLYISNGGMACSSTVVSSGRILILSGGSANDIIAFGSVDDNNHYKWGEIFVGRGGEAKNITLDYCGHLDIQNGSADNITVGRRAWLSISGGGSVTNVIEDGGYVEASEEAKISFVSHTFSGKELTSGITATVHSGTTAVSTLINSGGSLEIYSGGIESSTTINSCGMLNISSGGTATGKMTLEQGAVVSMNTESILDFDLTQTSAGEAALVNDLSIIQGTPVYTLTVDGNETGGTYSLADGAENFASTISVVNQDGEILETLKIGEKVMIGSNDYTLNLDEGELSLTVDVPDVTAPVITLSADTETVVLQTPITATVDDGSTIQYRIGDFGLWKEYKEPIIASLNETYYFMAMDDAGNIGTNQITFGNIDTSGILLSTLWSQRGINPMGGNTTILFNEYTPLDPGVTPEAHCLTGCVNTASGQLIYYFIEKGWLDLPLTLKKNDEYTSKHKATEEGGDPIVIPIKADGTTPGTLSFAEINAMLSDFQLDSAEHVAALLYAIGVVLESKYSANSTGTSWNGAFFKRAGFEGGTMGGPYYGQYYWGDMDDEMQCTISDAGFEVLIENLEAGLPVGATYPGHALVVDGYDRESDRFHVNFGWGGNQATRWYTRDEIHELNFESFVYDLNPECVETFTVTDARVYGTGTMIRAFEQAAGMIGDNTVAFDPSVAGKTVELLNHITLFDEVVTVKDFNMNVLVTKSDGGERGYGFYAEHIDVFEPTDPVTALTFHASGGSLIVSTEKEFNYAFQMEEALSCTVDANGMLFWAGKTSEGTSAAAVLQALQTSQSENTEVSADLLDPNGWSYFGSAGEDVFRLANSSLAVGKVSLGDGDDILSLTGHSRLYGNVDTGDGNDSITVDSTSAIHGNLAGMCNLNFVLVEQDDHAMFTVQSSASDLCADATVSVDMKDAEIGTYTLISTASGATGISDLQNLVVTVTGSGEADFTLSVNGTSTSDYADLIFEDDSLKLLVKKESDLIVTPQTQTWEEIPGAVQYIVEYSMDDFEHVIRLAVDSNSLDSYQLPEGDYQVRVKPDDGDEWTVIEPVVAEKVNDDPKLVRSNSDGNADAFYVNPVGTWEKGFAAQHVGSADDTWGGTKECVKLAGRNKLTDIFEGSSTDANVLLMTDDDNGDALFVDDIYSASPGELGLSQSRIARIDEIRAGAGDDIVDMTSNKFAYTGDGLVIRGGDGDDVIWANKGDNLLFGDAGNDRIVGASGDDLIVGGIGNDRMHGGGGDDVFTFCENWGEDTVEQLVTGTVTLWFTSESEDKVVWDEVSRSYTDGINSVKVGGTDSVELKFGKGTTPEDAARFAELSNAGAFEQFTSKKIFEESGILA